MAQEMELSRQHAFPILVHLQDGEKLWHLPPGSVSNEQDPFKALSAALQQYKDRYKDRAETDRPDFPTAAAYRAVRLCQTQPWPTASLLQRLLKALCALATEACSSLGSAGSDAEKTGVEVQIGAAREEQDLKDGDAAQEDLRVSLSLLCHTLRVTQTHFMPRVASKAGKKAAPAAGPVTVHQWLELKAASARTLEAVYNCILNRQLLGSAGDTQAAQKLATSTAIELALDANVPADKASKSNLESSRHCVSGILAQPFLTGSDAATADHLSLLLHSLGSQAPAGPDAIVRVVSAVHQKSFQASLSVLARLLASAGESGAERALRESSVYVVHSFVSQACAADRAAFGALFMQELARVLHAKECSVRKFALEVLADSLTAQGTNIAGHQQNQDMLNLLLAALLDRDVHVRAKAAACLGRLASSMWPDGLVNAETGSAGLWHCLQGLTSRLLDKTQVVRIAAAQALIGLLEAMPCEKDLPSAALAKQASEIMLPTLIHYLAAPPNSPLAHKETHQAVVQLAKLLMRSPDVRISLLQKLLEAEGGNMYTLGPMLTQLLPKSGPECLEIWSAVCSASSAHQEDRIKAILQQTATKSAILQAAFQQLHATLLHVREGAPETVQCMTRLLKVVAFGGGVSSTPPDAHSELLLLLAAFQASASLAFAANAPALRNSSPEPEPHEEGSRSSPASIAVCAALDALRACLANSTLAEGDTGAVQDVLMGSAAFLLSSAPSAVLHKFWEVLLLTHPSDVIILRILRSAANLATDKEQEGCTASLIQMLHLIGDLILKYELERDSFLALLSRSRPEEELEQVQEERPRPLEERHYMQEEDQRSRNESAAEAYIADIVAESLPVSVLPLLVSLLGDSSNPQAIQVAALQALGNIVLMTADLVSKHSALVVSLVQDLDRGCHVRIAALSVAEQLIQRYPGATDSLVTALCALLTSPDGEEAVVKAAAVAFARLLNRDKLKASYAMATLGAMLAPSNNSFGSAVIEIADFLMRSLMRSSGQNSSCVLLDVFKHTPEERRIQVAEIMANRFLTPAEIANGSLEGPLLQALFVASTEPPQAAAAILLSRFHPSAKSLTSLHNFLAGTLQAPRFSLFSARVIAAIQRYIENASSANARTGERKDAKAQAAVKKLQASCCAALQEIAQRHQLNLKGCKRKYVASCKDETKDVDDVVDGSLGSHLP